MEAASATENQQVEDTPSSRFTWTIVNFSRLNFKKHYSEIFIVGGYKWMVSIFPKGNNKSNKLDYFSIYLDVADSGSLPHGWSRYAQFSLAVINQVHSKYTIRKDTQHQFNSRVSDWGFTSFMPLSDLYDRSRGYLVNDTLVVEAEIVIHKVVDYWTYDSKKETGYVGLKNQGTTCYMNSLLQILYHIPSFRKSVYNMPTTENDVPSGSIPLALQSLFFRLQYSDSSVATKELTKSFGWNTNDSFIQHNVQELNRVLCEKLEDKMKGTVAEGTIQQLFEGHHMNYVKCINVDYESSRKESFYDLQLDVKGCRDVYASFDKYVEVVCLEGDKKYHAEQYGLQDAKRGALFIDLPPVLQLQLKRFKYDFMRDTMVKINDRYEFPLLLDLDRDDGKYLSPNADRSVRNLYTLHSVLVHRGGVHGGHYYAFIRPILSDQWFKFDDERVTKEETKRALEEQYGGEEELPQTNPGFNNMSFKFPKYSNAYMLVYIRESDKDKIMCSVDEKDIPKHLRIILKKEQEEKEHKEKVEAHLYTIIKVARDEDLARQIGNDIYFDLVDHDKVRSFCIRKQMLFKAFKEEVAKVLGIPVQFQRFWLWTERQNHTYRPNRPLSPLEEAQSVGQLREVSNKGHNAKLNLFLEVELGVSRPFFPPAKTKDNILLFFKLFDPVKEELRYVGRLFVKALGNPAEIITKLNEMAGFSPNEDIDLYEEIKFEPSVMCEHIDKKLNFKSSQLEDGDIICYQKCSHGSNDQCRYPDVPSFLEYVNNWQMASGGGNDRSTKRPITQMFRIQKLKSRSTTPITTMPSTTTKPLTTTTPHITTASPSYHSPDHHHTPYFPYTSIPPPLATYPAYPQHSYYSTPPPRPTYPHPTYPHPTYPQPIIYPQPTYPRPTTYPQPATTTPPTTTVPPPRVERLSQDTRRFIAPEGKTFNPSTQVTHGIRDIIKTNYNAPYISWTQIPQEVRDMWFRIFERKFYWLPQHHDRIRQNFEHCTSARFHDIFSDLYNSRKQPTWIGDVNWANLCATWDNLEYVKNMERNKQNRASDCGGLRTSLHIGDSIPMIEHMRKLKNVLGKDPIISEIHSATHQRQKTPEWVDPRAQHMNEYLCMEQYSQSSGTEESFSDASSQPSDFMPWSKAVGGKKKGITYELGAHGYTFEAQSSYTSSDYTSQTVQDVLMKQDELMTRMSRLETQAQQQQHDMVRQMAQQMARHQQEVARLLAQQSQQQHRHETEADDDDDDEDDE